MKVVDVKKELFDNKILILASDIISLSRDNASTALLKYQ